MPRRKIDTFRHPAMSLWQSALHEVLARRGVPPEEIPAHPAMVQTAAVGATIVENAPHHHGLDVCAHLFTRWAMARAEGHREEAARLESELRYQECDPLWIETVATYERSLLRSHQQAYTRHQQLDDFILEPLPDRATIALVADWGTGMPDAVALMEQVRTFHPDVVVHLGDIYYSGTRHEVATHFLVPLRRALGAPLPRVFALSGNHDRYSGGEGYVALLEQLGQPASYFCLRNASWQLVAMDTGLHDHDPRSIHHDMTWLEPTEAEWVRDKLQRRAGRGTILLSHHPLFSMQGSGHVDHTLQAVNPNLFEVVRDHRADVAWWFWGHEHDLLVFEPYVGLQRGRCIGAGAIPRLVGQEQRVPAPALVLPPEEAEPPRLVRGTELGNNGVVDNHTFVILHLDGPKAVARYYQSDSSDLIPGNVTPPGPPHFSEEVVLEGW